MEADGDLWWDLSDVDAAEDNEDGWHFKSCNNCILEESGDFE